MWWNCTWPVAFCGQKSLRTIVFRFQLYLVYVWLTDENSVFFLCGYDWTRVFSFFIPRPSIPGDIDTPWVKGASFAPSQFFNTFSKCVSSNCFLISRHNDKFHTCNGWYWHSVVQREIAWVQGPIPVSDIVSVQCSAVLNDLNDTESFDSRYFDWALLKFVSLCSLFCPSSNS